MQHECRQCQTSYEVSHEDRAFLDKIAPVFGGKKFSIPDPTLCPDCRQQRRAAHANEINLYKRKCDLTGKQILSDIHPSAPYKVYDQEVWYSDRWDPMDYGRDFDFSRPFFEQYKELCVAVPHMNLFTGYQYDENCDYTNYSGKNKNCYLIFDSDENRDCYYCYSLNGSRDCVDCFRVRLSELCYQCVDCHKCYSSSFLQDCVNCTDSLFLKNCQSCTHCLMCSNLINKEYHVENRPVTPEQFLSYLQSLRSMETIDAARARFEELKLQSPQKFIHGVQNENVTGDYLTECKNVRECFDGIQLWDCAHVYRAFMPVKDAMDCEAVGDGEKLYECCVVGYGANNLLFSANGLDQLSDYLYSTFCVHANNLFGCNGLRHKKYCVLNKQYSKEEYETLVPKIIEHMQKTGEWGEFFTVELSPFAYNESAAVDHYPLKKEDVLKKGWMWRERDEKEYAPQSYVAPASIDNVQDEILKETLVCRTCGKNYKVIAQELAFYRKRGIPPPAHCFECRHRARMAMRNPRRMYDRTCGKCGVAIRTTYSPERPEIVYCEKCYLDAVY